MDQRFRNHPKNKGNPRKADKKVKTIAGRLVSEIERKLPPSLYPGHTGAIQTGISTKENRHG